MPAHYSILTQASPYHQQQQFELQREVTYQSLNQFLTEFYQDTRITHIHLLLLSAQDYVRVVREYELFVNRYNQTGKSFIINELTDLPHPVTSVRPLIRLGILFTLGAGHLLLEWQEPDWLRTLKEEEQQQRDEEEQQLFPFPSAYILPPTTNSPLHPHKKGFPTSL